MDTNHIIESLLKYFRKENISVNKEMFVLQLTSHPSYPNLLSIVDTLEYFDIQHSVYNTTFEEVDREHDKYLTLLKGDSRIHNFKYLEKKKGSYFLNSQKVSVDSIKKLWRGIVLILEDDQPAKKKTTLKKSVYLALLILIPTSVYLSYDSPWHALFYIFPIIGILLSLTAVKDLWLDDPDHALHKFCIKSTTTDCQSVIHSKGISLFSKINFSDLSLIFFSSQLISYLILSFSGLINEYFIYQKLLLYLGLPVVLLALYFQKFVIKKWCFICLMIITLLLNEYIYLEFTLEQANTYTIQSFGLLFFIYVMISISWVAIKRNLIKIKELKEFKIKAIRFIRNYPRFKEEILKQKPFHLPQDLVDYNNNNKLNITIVSDPFCDFCKRVHLTTEKILARYPEKINFSTVLNVGLLDEYDDDRLFCQNLFSLQIQEDQNTFNLALADWFENQNIQDWLSKYKHDFDHEAIQKTSLNHKKWYAQNNLDFTPIVFINGYLFPKTYDIEHLDYFIQDLINDEDLKYHPSSEFLDIDHEQSIIKQM